MPTAFRLMLAALLLSLPVVHGQFFTGSCPPAGGSGHIVVPEGITHIADNHFAYCATLRTIDLPASLVGLGWSAFLNSGLESIDLSHTQVTAIYYSVFYICTSLNSVILHPNTTQIYGDAFRYCSSLPWLQLPVGCTVGANAFGGTPYGYGFVAPPPSPLLPPSSPPVLPPPLAPPPDCDGISVTGHSTYSQVNQGYALVGTTLDGKPFYRGTTDTDIHIFFDTGCNRADSDPPDPSGTGGLWVFGCSAPNTTASFNLQGGSGTCCNHANRWGERIGLAPPFGVAWTVWTGSANTQQVLEAASPCPSPSASAACT